MRAVLLLFASAVFATKEPGEIIVNHVERTDEALADTELIMTFVIFRHGDRTPDDEELEMNQSTDKKMKTFFPFGLKALTNAGKMRGYQVGEFLRRRYDGFISRFYLPNELSVRCTGFDRTKMTALTALAALYVPPPAQKWNPALDWQPVPYDVVPNKDDDFMYWYNCPRYLWLRNQVYELPEVKQRLKAYEGLYMKLTEYTHNNITTPEDVFYLDNLFQAEENVGIKIPNWAKELMPQIKEVTRTEFELEFYNDELVRLASGVLLNDILNITSQAIECEDSDPSPKLRLYSAHENNVAALMSAVRVFRPHQPKYGATFALELRRHVSTGRYGIAAIYAAQPNAVPTLLPIQGCGGGGYCDYDTFLNLTRSVTLTFEEYEVECPRLGR